MPVAKPINDQSYQSPHFTVSPSSPCSSLDDVIEHVHCFIGLPGTGKVPLGQSITHALGWLSQRIALGGVCDEGKCHRRYILSSLIFYFERHVTVRYLT